MKRRAFLTLGIGIFYLIISIGVNFLYSTIYGSISGQVVSEDTGKCIPGVGVSIHGYHVKTTKTDKDGRFSFQELTPGKYTILFVSVHPYCGDPLIEGIDVESGKNTIYNKVLKVGGSISGVIYKGDGVTPFPGVSILAKERFSVLGLTTSGEEGRYFIGRLCPSNNYHITADCKIPGYAYKVLQGVTVEKGNETKEMDIIFDLDDITGIEGYVTSSIDGKPLSEVDIAISTFGEEGIDMGEVVTDEKGYYSIRNLDSGIYDLLALPAMENLSFQEWSALCKDKDNIVVVRGEKTRVDFKLDI